MATRTVNGTLVDGGGVAIASVVIRFKAAANNYSSTPGTVPIDYEYTTTTNSSGVFSTAMAEGAYTVARKISGTTDRWAFMGNIVVAIASPNSAQNLGSLIDSTQTDFADFVSAGDYLTAAEVNALIIAGGVPGDIPITSLGVGTLVENEAVIRVGSGLTAYDVEGQILMLNFFGGGQ